MRISTHFTPWLSSVALASLVLACREPTELVVRVNTDIPCDQLRGTTITSGRSGDVETKPAANRSAVCDASGDIGALVIIPSGANQDEIALRLTAGIGRDVATCDASTFGAGCVVARRVIRYVPHQPLRLVVPLRASCNGIACDPQTTCVRGTCVPSVVSDPSACATAGGCDEDVLLTAANTIGDAGLDASRDASVDAGGVDGSGVDSGVVPSGQIVVLFGGEPSLADTWEWDGVAWAQRAASGPPARGLAGMAPINGKAVLFGGGQGVQLGDTWEWDGLKWTQRVVVGPAARNGPAMGAVAGGGKIVLFGGANLSGALADTWEWNDIAWTQRVVVGPPARTRAYLAPFGLGATLFGGAAPAPGITDTWDWNGASWTQRASTGPSGREGAAMALFGTKLVLFGGSPTTNVYLADTWEWDGATWTLRPVAGASPPSRMYGSMTAANGKLVLFGGFGPTFYGDTWEWDGNAWTERVGVGPPARYQAAMTTR